MIVMKFGGTSIGNVKRIKSTARIVVDHFQKKGKVVVVVSALTGVTDRLLLCGKLAVTKNKKELEKNLSILHEQHTKIIKELDLDKNSGEKVLLTIEEYLEELKKILDSMFYLGEVTKRGLDLIASFGERLIIHLVAAAIEALGEKARALEASDLIVTDDNFSDANVLFEQSKKKMTAVLPGLIRKGVIPVVTGFIGATSEGEITTLGRGGTDYSATIIAYCLNAAEVWIWKDVGGIMTADPKIVKGAKILRQVTSTEAAELSYFGAKILHPLTMLPAESKKIPVWIKNSSKPEAAGTKITYNKAGDRRGVKTIASITGLSLMTVQGSGMVGVSGTAARLFSALAEKKVNVIFISQASSEHNISFIVRSPDGTKAKESLEKAFQLELLYKRVEKILVEDRVAIVAVIGEGMKGKPGTSGKIFAALGDKKVNIMAIAQGSSELNISMVIKEENLVKAVESVHRAFRLGD